jgi:hypothetical protein
MRQKMINLIWTSIEEIERSVAKENSELKLRIGRLENPPKYAVGDVVKFDPNKKPNMFSPMWKLGYCRQGLSQPIGQTVLTGKIKWIEYKEDAIIPTYRIFCPEKEETYTVGEYCIIKKQENN